jgi:hypothetical protein
MKTWTIKSFTPKKESNPVLTRPSIDLARSYLKVSDLEFGAHAKDVKGMISDLLGYISELERGKR